MTIPCRLRRWLCWCGFHDWWHSQTAWYRSCRHCPKEQVSHITSTGHNFGWVDAKY